MSVVLVHDEMGVYLGSFLGLGIWSKLDPAGQDCAVAFSTEGQALRVAAGWENTPEGLRAVEVCAEDNGYVTIEECVKRGLDAWDPEG